MSFHLNLIQSPPPIDSDNYWVLIFRFSIYLEYVYCRIMLTLSASTTLVFDEGMGQINE